MSHSTPPNQAVVQRMTYPRPHSFYSDYHYVVVWFLTQSRLLRVYISFFISASNSSLALPTIKHAYFIVYSHFGLLGVFLLTSTDNNG